MITFLETQIKCGEIHSAPKYKPGRLLSNVTYFHGILGGSEIVNQQEGGSVSCLCWLNDATYTTATDLYEYLKLQYVNVGLNGTLVFQKTGTIFGSYTRTFQHATLKNIEEVALQGQDEPGPAFLVDNATPIIAVMYTWDLLLPHF